jgi:hypothetical protein
MGVITYFLLAGYRPFDRENQQLETQAIIAGDYKFGPGMFRYEPPQPYLTLGRTEGHWANVSQMAKEFVTMCLTVEPTQRPTASEVLKHRWLAEEKPHHVPDRMPIQNRVDARTRCEYPSSYSLIHCPAKVRRVVLCIVAIKRMSTLASLAGPGLPSEPIAPPLDGSCPVASELRTVLFPRDCLNRFASIASIDTARNRETCGLLLGKYMGGRFVVTTLLIPKQHATGDTCAIDEEEVVMQFTKERSLIVLGWVYCHLCWIGALCSLLRHYCQIHTHPTQSCACFLEMLGRAMT